MQDYVYPPGYLAAADFAGHARLQDPGRYPCTEPICLQGHAIPMTVEEPLMGSTNAKYLILNSLDDSWPDVLMEIHLYSEDQPVDSMMVANTSQWVDPQTGAVTPALAVAYVIYQPLLLHQMDLLDGLGNLQCLQAMHLNVRQFPDGDSVGINGKTMRQSASQPDHAT